MPLEKLQEFLDEKGVKYVTIRHSPAFTAQEVAASAHIPGRELAKTVMVEVDGEMAMAVLPAPKRVDTDRLAEAAGAGSARVASEDDFEALFPDCELGAMPPFGNLWDLDVYADRSLEEDEEIAFNAGTHTELVQLPYGDFRRLVEPVVADINAGG